MTKRLDNNANGIATSEKKFLLKLTGAIFDMSLALFSAMNELQRVLFLEHKLGQFLLFSEMFVQ